LVRLTTPIVDGDIKRSEKMLANFLGYLQPRLSQYIPD
jgi:hypothetical protein